MDKEYVMNIIDKHIKIYQSLMDKSIEQIELNDYASAITSLIMLKRELNGEIEY